jgi:hypothetical protein
MHSLCIHMRDFAHVQSKSLENHLGVDDEPTGAQL